MTDHDLARLMSGTHPDQQLDAEGRYVGGLFAGQTPGDVQESRRRFESAGWPRLMESLREGFEAVKRDQLGGS